jgi:hypothetical protein
MMGSVVKYQEEKERSQEVRLCEERKIGKEEVREVGRSERSRRCAKTRHEPKGFFGLQYTLAIGILQRICDLLIWFNRYALLVSMPAVV